MTIYALSSGPGIAGISVIRVSGKLEKKYDKKNSKAKNKQRKFNKINKNEL